MLQRYIMIMVFGRMSMNLQKFVGVGKRLLFYFYIVLIVVGELRVWLCLWETFHTTATNIWNIGWSVGWFGWSVGTPVINLYTIVM